MKQPCYVEIPKIEKLKLWCRAAFYAITVILKNALCHLWRKPTIKNQPENVYLPSLSECYSGNHSFVKANGVKFHYVQSGELKLPLLLLLHGFPDCWLGWRHQIKVLSQHFRVVAVDLKGFGDSEKPQWRTNYSIEILLLELRQIIRLLGFKRCVVIGHDLGAILGWFFAAQYPALVTKFVCISGAHPNVYWNQLLSGPAFNTRFIELCQVPSVPESEVTKDNYAMIEGFYKHLEKNGEGKLVDAYKYIFSRTKDITGPLHYLRNLPLFRLREAKLKVPTLLVVGANDPHLPVEALVRSAAFLASYEIQLVEGVGHFPHQEKPSFVNELLLSFLLEGRKENVQDKIEASRSIIGSLMSNTLRYGNSLVDNVVKSRNASGWRSSIPISD